MCHGIWEADGESRRAGQSLPPSEMPSLRPRRWAGAVAVAVVAVAAAAALLVPASTPAVSSASSGTIVEQAGRDDGVPVADGVQVADDEPVADGVPMADDVPVAGGGCGHDL